MGGMGSSNRCGGSFGQSDVKDFALVDQLLEHADRFLNGSLRVDSVLVVEVDPVRAQSSEGSFHGGPNVGGVAIDMTNPAPRMGDESEFRGQHNAIASA